MEKLCNWEIVECVSSIGTYVLTPTAQSAQSLPADSLSQTAALARWRRYSAQMAFVVREVHAAGYRSLRSIRFPVGQLSVFVGANGAGKTNLYRALQLLQASAAGTLSRELAAKAEWSRQYGPAVAAPSNRLELR
jgi:hypothetical protein